MPGREKEGRRAAVALDAGDEESLLGMRQLRRAMRPNRAAAMEVRVDEWPDRAAALKPRIEREPDFAHEREVGPEAGRDYQLVGRKRLISFGPLAGDEQRAALPRN